MIYSSRFLQKEGQRNKGEDTGSLETIKRKFEILSTKSKQVRKEQTTVDSYLRKGRNEKYLNGFLFVSQFYSLVSTWY